MREPNREARDDVRHVAAMVATLDKADAPKGVRGDSGREADLRPGVTPSKRDRSKERPAPYRDVMTEV